MNHAEVKHLKVDHTPAVLDTASRVLLRAAEMLERDGEWGQGRFEPGVVIGRNCMILAVREVDGHSYEGAAERKLLRAFGTTDAIAVFNWNDAPERTKEEVVAKLRAVAFAAF